MSVCVYLIFLPINKIKLKQKKKIKSADRKFSLLWISFSWKWPVTTITITIEMKRVESTHTHSFCDVNTHSARNESVHCCYGNCYYYYFDFKHIASYHHSYSVCYIYLPQPIHTNTRTNQCVYAIVWVCWSAAVATHTGSYRELSYAFVVPVVCQTSLSFYSRRSIFISPYTSINIFIFRCIRNQSFSVFVFIWHYFSGIFHSRVIQFVQTLTDITFKDYMRISPQKGLPTEE